MEYHFNYRLLSEFLNLNTALNKTALMRAINTKDYSSVQRYIDGEITPPIEHLLRLSNAFQIPLSAWFFNKENDRELYFGLPIEESYCTPKGGWYDGHDHGGRKRLSPVVSKRIAAVIPKMATERTDTVPDETQPSTLPSAKTRITELEEDITALHLSHEKEIDRIKAQHERDLSTEKKRHKKALKEAADRHAAERLELIDIIKAQQETINRLTRQGIHYTEPEQTMQVAAEPTPKED